MTTQNWANVDNKPVKKKAKKKAAKKAAKRKSNEWDSGTDQAKSIYSGWTAFKSWYPPQGSGLTEDEQRMKNRLMHSAKMVQTWVDALAGSGPRYQVGISPSATTASSDLKNRSVQLPAKIILDPALNEEEAALLMVAYLAHEIGHIRFDHDLYKAFLEDQTVLMRHKQLYGTLSNLLREHRVESGFSELFPGYGGLFQPLLRWISRGTKDGSTPPDDALGFAVAATRYPFRFDWSDPNHATEAAWWSRWVSTYQDAEDYKTHRQALVEASDHIEKQLPRGDSPYSTTVAPTFDLNRERDRIEDTFQQEREQAYARYKDALDKNFPSPEEAVGQAVKDAADEYQEYREEVAKKYKDALQAVEREAKKKEKQASSIPLSIEDLKTPNLPVTDRKKRRKRTDSPQAITEHIVGAANAELGMEGNGTAMNPMVEKPRPPMVDDSGDNWIDHEAASVFRSMFMRMRGGFDGRIPNRRRGRLDDGKVWRLADSGDDRLFTRRGAPKTQRLRVYVMVDMSGSMKGTPEDSPPPYLQARGMSYALAEASTTADTLHLEIFGWDDRVFNAYTPGDDPASVASMRPGGATSDARALRWAIDKMVEEKSTEEHGLILMLSDGNGQGMPLVKHEVEIGREKGLSIFGMGIGPIDLSEAYGETAWTPFKGSVAETAQPMAEIIATAWTSRDQRRD